MFARFIMACGDAIRTWWLTSRFVTYQSPLRLLQLQHTCALQQRCRNATRIALGDTVHLVDTERYHQYRMTLVASHQHQPLSGQLAWDSYLGSALMGRARDDVLELRILGRSRRYAITEIVYEVQPPARPLRCGCVLCQ